MTVLEWLAASCRYSFESDIFVRIAEDRGIEEPDVTESKDLTAEQKELMTADIIFTAMMLSPSSTSSKSVSHNNFQKTIGSETDIYQNDKISFALAIYKRYDDPKYEALAAMKPKIKLLKIVDVI